MDNKHQQRGRLAWIMLALNLLAALLLVAAIWHLRAEGYELKNLYSELRGAQLVAHEQQTASSLLQETSAERESLARSIVTEASLPQFIETLEQIARVSGVELELTQATPASGTNPNITLALSIEGGRSNMVRFARLLDAMPTQMQIKHARVGTEKADYYLELLGYGI